MYANLNIIQSITDQEDQEFYEMMPRSLKMELNI